MTILELKVNTDLSYQMESLLAGLRPPKMQKLLERFLSLLGRNFIATNYAMHYILKQRNDFT
jgi:hypothetical protein